MISQNLGNTFICMAKSIDRDPGREIQVLSTLSVPNLAAFAFVKDQRGSRVGVECDFGVPLERGLDILWCRLVGVSHFEVGSVGLPF